MRLKILKNAIMIGVFFSTPSFSLSMKIQQNCSIPNSRFQVEISNPSGGHVKVNPDGMINLPANVHREHGFLLSVLILLQTALALGLKHKTAEFYLLYALIKRQG